MSLVFVLVILFFYIILRRKFKPKENREKFSLSKSRKWIALLILFISPILVAQIWFSEDENLREDTLTENLNRFGQDYQKRFHYYRLFQEYEDSVELRFDFIDEIFKNQQFSCWSFLKEEYGGSDRMKYLSHTYGLTTRFMTNKNTCGYNINDWDFDTTDLPYNHYFLGQKELINQNFEEAEKHFLKELEINPSNARNNEDLLYYYHVIDNEKLPEHLNDPDHLIGVDHRIKRMLYFNEGKWDAYFKEIYLRSFVKIDTLAIFSALIISILWLLFLQKLDIYRPEKWIDIIIVFILGCVFTNLCLFFYDYARSEGFSIGESVWKDLAYNLFVIGFSEELVKLIPWILYGFLTKKLKEPYDYILYASVSALGFAFIENWMYLEDPWNITIRTVMSVTMHMFAASVFAYSLVLYRFKYRNKKWKIALPFIGFLGAIFAHGFYDFWIISEFVSEFSYFTKIGFIIFFHIWFYFINNSMNNSPFFNLKKLDRNFQIDIVIFGFVIILMTEYLYYCYEYGADGGTALLIEELPLLIVFGIYTHILINQLKPTRQKWYNYSMPLFGTIGKYLMPRKEYDELEGFEEIEDHMYDLKLFVQKSNRHVSHLFPMSGFCEKPISVDGKDTWYLFRCYRDLGYSGHHSRHLIIKVKDNSRRITDDKVEILMLFIPLHINIRNTNFYSKSLTYTGPAFSRPNN